MAAVLKVFEAIGWRTAKGFDEWGFAAALLAESILWVFVGRFYRQPVRFSHTFTEMVRFGIAAADRHTYGGHHWPDARDPEPLLARLGTSACADWHSYRKVGARPRSIAETSRTAISLPSTSKIGAPEQLKSLFRERKCCPCEQ
jgi:hypothetical protein